MGQRGNGTGGWWLWVITGVVVTIGGVVLLEPWFRVSSSTVAGWGALAAATFRDRRRSNLRSPAFWVFSAAMVLLFVGVALLLGAAGLATGERTDSALPGAVLGGVMVASAVAVTAVILLVLRARQRRRSVSDEIERHRAEQAAPTLADDLS